MAKKGKSKQEQQGPATIVNRRARHDYQFDETHEAGLMLAGPEVKSIFQGNVQLVDAYCRIDDGELWLCEMYIAPYAQASHYNVDTRRKRKLLMHRSEIKRLQAKAQEKGYAIIPLKIYFNSRGKAKVEIGLGRGKKHYDKRESIKERDEARRQQRGED